MWILMGAVVLLVVAAACGGGDDGNAAADDGGTTSTATTAGTGPTGDDSGRYGGGDDGDEGEDGGGNGAATVQANNFAFHPADVEITAGEDLTLKNGNANTPHTFTVDGTDVDVELAPLAEEEATIDLEPGSYDFFCRLHPDMQGTLIVT
jgi:plastocyanin